MTQMIMAAGGVLVAVVCGVLIRKQTPEIALVLTMCAAVAMLLAVSGQLEEIVTCVQQLVELGGISNDLVAPVMRATGIAIVTKFTAEFCRDAKEQGLASAVELAGTVLGLVASLPLIHGVLALLEDLMR